MPKLRLLLLFPVLALIASCGSKSEPVPPPEADAAVSSKPPAAGRPDTAASRKEAAAPVASVPTVAGPCRMQGNERLDGATLRALGTEPFWAARVEGRCVTYSHPEDQKGTRVWTRYSEGAAGKTWSGALNGHAFEFRIRPEPGCSDGMSDKLYPLAADLTVNGEKRSGCAEPV